MTAAGRAGMARGSVQPGTVAAAAAAAVSDLAEWSGLLPLEHRAAPALTHPEIVSAVGVYHAGPLNSAPSRRDGACRVARAGSCATRA